MRKMPEYLKIADILQEEIISSYRPGDRLPSEYMLCTRFNASRYIVRQAMTRLTQVGLIKPHQGVGYFVNNKPLDIRYAITPVTQFSQIVRDLGHVPGAKLIHKEEALAPTYIVEAFHMKTPEKVYKLEIIRYVDDVPLAYNTTWLPAMYFDGLLKETENFTSLYTILRDKYKVNPLRMNSVIQSIAPYARDAQYLNISPNTPLLQIESLVKDEKNRYIEYTVAKYRGDLCRVSIEFED
ncbi:MAG: GntR family transcriptional regulator [Clostridiales bacterium]|jgi:GntR family transcriptional regulator|nr:GntR family transcriptional regulator [Clostridiales bacterium]MDK2992844.1 GntR family transcriptional regulator [Clostridiales bacterium]